MKRYIALVLAAVLILTVLAGCGDKNKETGTPAQSGSQAQTQTQTQDQSAGDSRLTDIFNKGNQAKEMSYEMVTTISGSGAALNTTSKMYVSDKKFRMETETMGMKNIMIANAQGEVYMYNTTDNSAMKMTMPQSTDTPSSWFKDLSAMKVVGEEKKDGYDCLVVTLTQAGNTTKMWLRKDIGMPVRTEQTTPQGQVVVEFKNFQTGPQPASLFEIPAGTKITTMSTTP